MAQLTKEEVVKIFQDFLDEKGMFFHFKDFIESQGYKLEEVGMEEE